MWSCTRPPEERPRPTPSRTKLVVGLLVLSVLGGCRPAAAAAEPGAGAASARAASASEGFWWTLLGEQSAAVASFGPTLEAEGTSLRPWSLIVFLPGSSEPLSCVQGRVELEGALPIVVHGGSFRVELQPVPGRTWGEVADDSQITARAEGIH